MQNYGVEELQNRIEYCKKAKEELRKHGNDKFIEEEIHRLEQMENDFVTLLEFNEMRKKIEKEKREHKQKTDEWIKYMCIRCKDYFKESELQICNIEYEPDEDDNFYNSNIIKTIHTCCKNCAAKKCITKK